MTYKKLTFSFHARQIHRWLRCIVASVVAASAVTGCGDDDHQRSIAPTAEQNTDDEIIATESSNETAAEPTLFFRVFGTEPDEGPGQHYAGACKLDAEPENLLLFSIHSPGHRNGGSKGGSSRPTIEFGRTMKMDWVSGIDADQYQSYSIDMRLQFEKSRSPFKEQNAGLTPMVEVRFGKQQVPVYRIDEVTVPGVLPGYHAWFRVMQTNHAPYTAEYSGTTGDLYAHLSMRKIGRTRSDNDPWTETVVTTIFESFYTQDCFVDYLKAYVPMREATSVTIVD